MDFEEQLNRLVDGYVVNAATREEAVSALELVLMRLRKDAERGE